LSHVLFFLNNNSQFFWFSQYNSDTVNENVFAAFCVYAVKSDKQFIGFSFGGRRSRGSLSVLQLDIIKYAFQQHKRKLPDWSRAGYFIGDDAGVGKAGIGRAIAGIILENHQWGNFNRVSRLSPRVSFREHRF
jgi:hypothetical protein